jgi:hypothetical protein
MTGRSIVNRNRGLENTQVRAVVVQFGLRSEPVKREIPSASLRAGSSLRLKNGYAQDDSRRVIQATADSCSEC